MANVWKKKSVKEIEGYLNIVVGYDGETFRDYHWMEAYTMMKNGYFMVMSLICCFEHILRTKT